MRYLVLLSLLVLMTACDAVDWLPSEPAGTLLDDRSIIFTESMARNLTWAADYTVDNKQADKDGAWQPTADDVAVMQAALEKRLADEPRMEGDSIEGYYRQFFGFSVEGTKYIYGEYFCESDNFDWQQNLVFVMDGGTCFVDAAYNPATGEFVSLYIHGYA